VQTKKQIAAFINTLALLLAKATNTFLKISNCNENATNTQPDVHQYYLGNLTDTCRQGTTS